MGRADWVTQLTHYESTDIWACARQIATSFIPYIALMLAMFYFLQNGASFWAVGLLWPVAALFLGRIFIILHDCSHKSYLRGSPGACFVLGHICGIFTFTSFFAFRNSHIIHHATVGNLDKRGVGDVWTLTVDEYRVAPYAKKFLYRLFRNPFFLFVIAPVFKFVVLQRLPVKGARFKEILSIFFTDAMIVLLVWLAISTVGVKTYVAVQLPVIFFTSSLAVWIFYIHHQFENTYWARNDTWDRFDVGLKGSVFYQLPGFLRWITGNIGYHHVHHLNARIPNYNLEKAQRDIPQLREVSPTTLWGGFRSASLALWDEKRGRLVSFSSLKRQGA
ncbi:MAG: fatty acid desaturase [Candidatus Omnitrophota bacterium]